MNNRITTQNILRSFGIIIALNLIYLNIIAPTVISLQQFFSFD